MKAVDIAFRWCAPEPIDLLFFQDTLAVRAGKRVERLGTYQLPFLPRSQDCSKPSPSSMAVIISFLSHLPKTAVNINIDNNITMGASIRQSFEDPTNQQHHT